MKKSLLFAAAVALGLTVFGPADSIAKGFNVNSNQHGNGYTNGNTNGEYCPPDGNNHKVPEPGTMALLGAAALGAIYLKNRGSRQ